MSVPGHETFVGYYDISPISADGGALLAHAGKARRRSLRASDEVRIGYFDLAGGGFVDVGQTSLWNWQLGARLFWWPEGERTLAFNRICDGKPSFCAAGAGEKPRPLCDKPVFDVTQDARVAVALNFGRLASARPGYGYPAMADPFAGQCLPAGDGVTLVDLTNARYDLLYSLHDFAGLVEDRATDAFHYLNGATLSPGGKRFSVLYNRMRSAGDPDGWDVDAVVGNIDGSRLHRIPLPARASHYWWLDDESIAFTTSGGAGSIYWLYDTGTQKLAELHANAPGVDGHPSLNPVTGAWLTDCYPDFYGEQSLFLFGGEHPQLCTIGKLAADARYTGEWRCDLHPRWSPDGAKIVVDSTHEGFRAIYLVDARSDP